VQELLTTYTNSRRSRAERQQFLSEQYGFDCKCTVCSLPEHDSLMSDDRLRNMAFSYQLLAAWGRGAGLSGPDAIEVVRRIWQNGDFEGYWSERGALAWDAVEVACAHSE
jgi:hypothetical protein